VKETLPEDRSDRPPVVALVPPNGPIEPDHGNEELPGGTAGITSTEELVSATTSSMGPASMTTLRPRQLPGLPAATRLYYRA
jgi:hypothetical protein